MFIEDLFIIIKSLKQPSCSTKDEWINKLWHIPTMDYYSVLRTEYTVKPWEKLKNAHCLVKEANLEKLYTMISAIQGISKKLREMSIIKKLCMDFKISLHQKHLLIPFSHELFEISSSLILEKLPHFKKDPA